MIETKPNTTNNLVTKKLFFLKTTPPRRASTSFFSVDTNFYPIYNGVELTLSQKKIIQAITIMFKSWQSWQKEILFSGFILQYNKYQLRSLSMSVESLFHRDFVTTCQNVYPMHKVQESSVIHTSDVFNYCSSQKSSFSQSSVTDQIYSRLNFSLQLSKSFSFSKEKSSRMFQTSKQKIKKHPNECKNVKIEHYVKTTPSFVNRRNLSVKFTNSVINNEPSGEELIQSCSSSKYKELSRESSLVSLPSIWSMGESIAISEDEVKSNISTETRPTIDYFPSLSRPSLVTHFATTSSKTGLEHYLCKFSSDRNKVPLPTTLQMNKNQMLWSRKKSTIPSKKFRLKELFQKQLSQIWEWIRDWEDHKRTRLLLHLLSFSMESEKKFVADCLKNKIKDIKAEEKASVNFPWKVWMNIVDYLMEDDVESAEKVCKPWNFILSNDDFWIAKCNKIEMNLNLTGLVDKVASIFSDDGPFDWRKVYFMMKQYISAQKEVPHKDKSETFNKELRKIDADGLLSFIKSGFIEVATNTENRVNDKSGSFTDQSMISFDSVEGKIKESKLDVREAETKFAKAASQQSLSKHDSKSYFIDLKQKLERIEQELKLQRTLKQKEKELLLRQNEDKQDESEENKWTRLRGKLQSSNILLQSSSNDLRQSSSIDLLTSSSNRMLLSSSDDMLQSSKSEQDIKEKEDKNRKTKATQKLTVNLFSELLSADELEEAIKKVANFAVDYSEKGSQRTKPWITDTYIKSVINVVALKGHVGPVWCVIARGNRIISGGKDRKVRFWTKTGDCFASIEECAKGGIIAMAIRPDERCRTFYAASWDRTITVYDSVSCKQTGFLTGHKDTVSGVAVTRNYLVSSSYDSTIRVWDIKTYQLLLIISHHIRAILCMEIIKNWVVTGGADRRIIVSDLKSGNLIKVFSGHTAPVTAIKVQKNLIVSGDRDGFVSFWALKGANQPVFAFRAHEESLNSIELNNGRFFTASNDKQVKEWNLLTMKCVRTLQGHSMPVTCVKYTKDYLVTSSQDSTVRVWWWDQKVSNSLDSDEEDLPQEKSNEPSEKITN